jgi:hypothetical protein
LGLGAASALGGAGADEIALNIGEASEYRQHQAPGAAGAVGPWFGQGSELRLGVHDALDDPEEVKGAAREAVKPRHCQNVAGREGKVVEHSAELNTPLCHQLPTARQSCCDGTILGSPPQPSRRAPPAPYRGPCTLTYQTTKPL